MEKYLISYWHDGAWWSLDLPAADADDAAARLAAIGRGRVDGVVKAKIPVAPSWTMRLFGR